MKKVLSSTMICLFIAGFVNAQSTTNPQPKTLWTAPKVVCDPYKAEKQLEKGMSAGVRAFYNASQDKQDKQQNAVKEIICNPPTRSSDSKTTRKAN